MKDETADLINYGVHVLNAAPCPEQATIFAFGLGRSGTTMLSRAMAELGIFMGEKITPQTHEDKDIQLAIKARDMKAFKQICRRRDADHDRWGFKCPAARGDVSGLASRMRNPRAIVVFRDIVAIALRNSISVDAEVIPGLQAAAKANVALIDEVIKAEIPTLVVSYEKALQYPDRLVMAIAAHSGIEISEERARQIARDRVANGDPTYLYGASN
ncbi:hypothetical protein ATO6_22680 [Oceanicola sp. 22II-s10i]|uniref:hypothetical protein n=1 Tax=Oceanicola sp. 22II-s10i TaxID=1317116 RepID=UPI000B51F99B|nr:hypothetical protein [Oceanicola sp. 22II-s10i]OWU82252.1 hypothetical protein ATO6_22680 [Oceanicola sp. 22II-s10i]